MFVCVCVFAQSGCGTVVLVEEQTVIHSPNYPQSYSNDCVVRWVVYAPPGHVVKVDSQLPPFILYSYFMVFIHQRQVIVLCFRLTL